MDKTEKIKTRKAAAHKPKQPPSYQPTEAPPLNIVTFSFRPLQAKISLNKK
jgi:hypothetical protein